MASFAIEINSDAKNKEYPWTSREIYKPRIQSKPVRFNEDGIDWVFSNSHESTGLERQAIRVDFHHTGQVDKNAFFRDISILLDKTNIQFLSYREYLQNFMMFASNGRQGVSGEPVILSDVQQFYDELLVKIKQYDFILSLNQEHVGLGAKENHYSTLVGSEKIVVKDSRYQ